MLNNLMVEKKSGAGEMSKTDWQAAAKQALIFLGPALLVLLASVIEVIPGEAKYGVIVLFLLNRVTDLLRRYLADNKKK